MKTQYIFIFTLFILTKSLYSMDDVFLTKVTELQSAAYNKALEDITNTAAPLLDYHITTHKPLTTLFAETNPHITPPQLLGILDAALITLQAQAFNQGAQYTLKALKKYPKISSNETFSQQCGKVHQCIQQQTMNEFFNTMKIRDKDNAVSELPDYARGSIDHALQYYRDFHVQASLQQLADPTVHNNFLDKKREEIYHNVKMEKRKNRSPFEHPLFTYPLFTACVVGAYKIIYDFIYR